MTRRGFTIVELIIVITIIGILLTLAVVGLSGTQAKARDDERKADIEAIATHLESYYQSGGSSSAAGTTVTNLVTNPSMESNSTGWFAYLGVSSPTRVASNPASGSARLSAVGNNSSTTPRVYFSMPATAGQVMSVSVKVRSDGGQTPTGLFANIKATSGGTEFQTLGAEFPWQPDTTGWATGVQTFTVPPGADGIRINPGIRTATNYTGTLGIDSVIVVNGDNIPLFADGNTPGWAWSGSANSSTSSGPFVVAGTPGTYPYVYVATPSLISVAFPDADQKTFTAPGETTPYASFVRATNADQTTAGVQPQPTTSQYVYQPITSGGSLCRDTSCRKFNLYYRLEEDNTVYKYESKNR